MKFAIGDIIESNDGNDDRKWVIEDVNIHKGFMMRELDSDKENGLLEFMQCPHFRKFWTLAAFNEFKQQSTNKI